MIDYKAQFKHLSEEDWNEAGSVFPRCRLFQVRSEGRTRTVQARLAFKMAQSLEDEGISVAFGEFCGDYYVWSE